MTKPTTSMVAVDGTDALAFVLIRPGSTPDTVTFEGAANGLPKATAAYLLRQVADRWEAEAAAEDAQS
ncbi:hypothetical protein ACFXD5_06790 [Streptomyces sp. NPDC059385]|uniref:hypothetical protein n=1 Tax=Streptomyces sp. NPDC059385 TaxID=3346817 RepID=UPI00369972E3